MNQQKIDYVKIGALSDIACMDIERLFDALGVSLERNGRKYTGACCIHGGDNRTALNIYPEGDTYNGNWKCRTRGCQSVFKSSLIGFARGALSAKKFRWSRPGDSVFKFGDTIDYVCKVYNVNWNDLKVDYSKVDKRDYLAATRYLVAQHNPVGMSREKVRSKLVMPCQYYLDRGFSREILDTYGVGLCDKPNKIFTGRAVIPIFDDTGQFMVGATARLVYGEGSKWIHNGFRASEHLYNLWSAYNHIKESQSAILVESPANAWKMVESGYHNVVGLFGVEFNLAKQFLLEKLGVLSITTILDADRAGDLARAKITEECSRYYSIRHLIPTANDVAEMTVKEVQNMMNANNNISEQQRC